MGGVQRWQKSLQVSAEREGICGHQHTDGMPPQVEEACGGLLWIHFDLEGTRHDAQASHVIEAAAVLCDRSRGDAASAALGSPSCRTRSAGSRLHLL